MNERIKELAAQADNYAYKMNPEEDSYGRAANPRKFQQDRDTKFAELIVQECLTFVEPMPGSGDIDDLALEGAYNGIKEHFGVK